MRDQREFKIQCAIADLLQVSAHRDTIWFAVPNGEARSAVTGARIKRMGGRPGVADFSVTLPGGHQAFLEIKAGKGKQSAFQRLFEAHCARNGALYAVVRSSWEAQSILQGWGALKGKRLRPAVQLPLKGIAAGASPRLLGGPQA